MREAVQRYGRSRRPPTPHQLVRGLRLEGVLRELADDQTATPTARDLAAAALLSGSSWTLAALAEELEESGHPSSSYRWHAAADGLELDSQATAELDELAAAGFGSRAKALKRLRARVEADPESPPELVASLRRLARHH